MAVEFGAKLYLKDNMYATLKKNLGLQREFSEQVEGLEVVLPKHLRYLRRR